MLWVRMHACYKKVRLASQRKKLSKILPFNETTRVFFLVKSCPLVLSSRRAISSQQEAPTWRPGGDKDKSAKKIRNVATAFKVQEIWHLKEKSSLDAKYVESKSRREGSDGRETGSEQQWGPNVLHSDTTIVTLKSGVRSPVAPQHGALDA